MNCYGLKMNDLMFYFLCSGEEGLRPQAPVKPQRNRKALSCDSGKKNYFFICMYRNTITLFPELKKLKFLSSKEKKPQT